MFFNNHIKFQFSTPIIRVYTPFQFSGDKVRVLVSDANPRV